MSKSTSGFTVVELVIVVSVIAVLAALVIVTYQFISRDAYQEASQSDVANAIKQIDTYRATNFTTPGSITNCPTPSAANICVKTNGNTLLYEVNTNGNTGDGNIGRVYGVGSVRGKQGYYSAKNEWTISCCSSVAYMNLAPLIDAAGLRSYRMTFEAKADVASNVTLAFSNAKYSGLNRSIALTSGYVSQTVDFTAATGSAVATAPITITPSGSSKFFIRKFTIEPN